jgi:ABC-2 type transport system permease protein
MDTVFSPIMSTVLFLAVFGVVAGQRDISGIPFLSFIYAGLLAMMVINSSFSNPTFALILSKNVGTIIDLQIAPIRAWRIGLAYAAAALTRALLTLMVTIAITAWFIPEFGIRHPFILLIALIVTGVQYGMLGVVFGMWAKNFEALTFVTTFVMQPMIFLAGVFYPVTTLPTPWNTISQLNPLHHNVNLLRYGFTGYSDTAPLISLGIALGMSAILLVLVHVVTRKTLEA